jgi:hypothetical protein
VSISFVTSTTDKLQSSPVATQQLLLQAIYTLEIRNEQKRTKNTTRNSVKIVTLVHKKLGLRDEDDLGVAEEECIPLMQVLPAC